MGVTRQKSYVCDRCGAMSIMREDTHPPNWRVVRIDRYGQNQGSTLYWYCQHCAILLEDFHRGNYRPVDDKVNKLTPQQLLTPE